MTKTWLNQKQKYKKKGHAASSSRQTYVFEYYLKKLI